MSTIPSRQTLTLVFLALLLAAVFFIAIGSGPVVITPPEVLAILLDTADPPAHGNHLTIL